MSDTATLPPVSVLITAIKRLIGATIITVFIRLVATAFATNAILDILSDGPAVASVIALFSSSYFIFTARWAASIFKPSPEAAVVMAKGTLSDDYHSSTLDEMTTFLGAITIILVVFTYISFAVSVLILAITQDVTFAPLFFVLFSARAVIVPLFKKVKK
jgi:hypothetical protein